MKKSTIPIPIWKITDADALDTAKLTGYDFCAIRRTDWGIIVENTMLRFCIRWIGVNIEMGMIGILTPNIDIIADFLRWKGYDLRTPKSDGSEAVTQRHRLTMPETRT